MSLTFVNYRGEPVSTVATHQRMPRPTAAPDHFHKGFKVVGFSPARVSDAEREHVAAQAASAQPKPFDLESWMRTHKPSAVRSQPYALKCAAEQCAELARRAGWLDVQINAIERGPKGA